MSRTSPQNNSETVTNEHDKEIPKERYISLVKRLKIIDDLRLCNDIIIEYQKIINLLANALDQPSKFREKDCVGINDGSCGTYNSNNQIRFKS